MLLSFGSIIYLPLEVMAIYCIHSCQNLYHYVSYCLTLVPVGCVERVFSQIKLKKTKTRNRLSTETLCGILYSKNLIKHENKNCFDYIQRFIK